uniref:Uncharacterized protein n=1 Tax=Myotis myotis TaxID=51298 RepID=A0A7J7RN61_MYOMY|nr:hypothetical protein mMyoMyo1_010254 [Myotis myotis]
MFPLLFCCIWMLRFKKTIKEPPPVQKPEKVLLPLPNPPAPPTGTESQEEQEGEPETCPIQTCPTVTVPCGCQEDSMQRIEDKLDILCDFVQNYNQVPLMCFQPSDKLLLMVPKPPSDMLPTSLKNVSPHQLLLVVPTSPSDTSPTSLKDAAADPPHCPCTLQNYLVTPTP